METSKLTTILFDLDGTLLPLEQKRFVSTYFSLFIQKCKELGYEPDIVAKAFKAGLSAMLEGEGILTNKQRFEYAFEKESSIEAISFNRRFASFYDEEFCSLVDTAAPSEYALSVVKTVKAKGYTVVLATTPLFPWQAVHHRIAWAGLKPELFDLITTYEDFHYAKPHIAYYQQILDRLGCTAQECLMVGNDVLEDMVAQKLGMQVYLVTDCLMNEAHRDIASFPHGSLSDLLMVCKELESV